MIDFLKYRFVYFVISALVIGAGLFSMLRWGFIYSIDFVGGTNLEYQIGESVEGEGIREILQKQDIDVVSFSTQGNRVILRTKPVDEKKEFRLRKTLEKETGSKIILLRFETVGPTLGAETVRKTVIAFLVGVVAILLYMTFAFRGVTYALAAIFALFHDILVMVGVYSLLSHFLRAEVDTLFVTAVLTTMSFSVHDTIVIFDKIREYVRYDRRADLEEFANKALTETMVRSVNNSMTIVFMLLSLLLLGGSTIKFFAAALLVGTITGTYSSPFVATPILVWLEKRKKK